MKNLFLILFLTIGTFSIQAQYPAFQLNNPSFEGEPGAMNVPDGWFDAGFVTETSSDTHPSSIFGVAKMPKDGNTYIGMVTRENDTWESIGQRLSVPLEVGICYEFSVYLAKSETYYSSDKPEDSKNYNKGVVLRIWGGPDNNKKAEKLAESSVVDHGNWQLYKFKLKPAKKARTIFLEAYYKTPVLMLYGGNILIDHISEILPVDCQTDQPLIEEELAVVEPKIIKEKPQKNIVIPKPKKEVKKKPKYTKDSKYKNIRNGYTINIDKLTFAADAYKIEQESYAALDEIYDFLRENDDLVVEIGGHTNNIPSHETCNKLSTARAKSVADYLVKKGLSNERIKYKGYGKFKPKYSNKTSQGRKGNQRVEIKVIRIDG